VYTGVPGCWRQESSTLPVSNPSKPSSSNSATTTAVAVASSPTTGAAIRRVLSSGRRRVSAPIVLNALMTGRPRICSVQRLSTSPSSSAAIGALTVPHGPGGVAVAAMSVSIPTPRYDDEVGARALAELGRTVGELSTRLGYVADGA
jgi:hypothetical protein